MNKKVTCVVMKNGEAREGQNEVFDTYLRRNTVSLCFSVLHRLVVYPFRLKIVHIAVRF